MRITGKELFPEESQGQIIWETAGSTRLTVAGDGTITPAGTVASITASSASLKGPIQIGGATDTVGFFGATPVAVQSSTATSSAQAFVAGGATAATSASQWSGNTGTKTYGMGDVVSALKAYGILTS